MPILGSRTSSNGAAGYIWCRKMPSCSNGVTWPGGAINGPNGCVNIEGGVCLEPPCLADGTRPGSPDHLLDSHKHELVPVQNKRRENHKSNLFSGSSCADKVFAMRRRSPKKNLKNTKLAFCRHRFPHLQSASATSLLPISNLEKTISRRYHPHSH